IAHDGEERACVVKAALGAVPAVDQLFDLRAREQRQRLDRAMGIGKSTLEQACVVRQHPLRARLEEERGVVVECNEERIAIGAREKEQLALRPELQPARLARLARWV